MATVCTIINRCCRSRYWYHQPKLHFEVILSPATYIFPPLILNEQTENLLWTVNIDISEMLQINSVLKLTVRVTRRKCEIILNHINASAIRTQQVQSVLALNVKQLHSSICFLNLPPSLLLLLLMLSAPSLSVLTEDLGWLLVVDGCVERSEEARWRGEDERVQQRNDGVLFAPLCKFWI